MCIDALYKAFTVKNNICIFACPYEIQVRKIFERLSELINDSPILKREVISNTKSPFQITLKNESKIKGFTTGAASGGGADNIRGQRADAIYLDESDYMNDTDFDSILALSAEGVGTTVFLSSTPTGARKRFWQCCTDPKMHFKEFHYPSMCNPNWGPEMEEEFRSQLSVAGYTHEILAEFGEQETGVFNKDRLDEATRYFYYTYDKLTMSQRRKIEDNDIKVADYVVPAGYSGVYRPNIFRTMGIDWDKIGLNLSCQVVISGQ